MQKTYNRILEVHQNGEAYTAQHDQYRQIEVEWCMTAKHQRIGQAIGQRTETCITES